MDNGYVVNSGNISMWIYLVGIAYFKLLRHLHCGFLFTVYIYVNYFHQFNTWLQQLVPICSTIFKVLVFNNKITYKHNTYV